MKSFIFLITLIASVAATQAADTVFVSLLTNSDTTVRMTSSGSSAYGPAAKKLVVSGLSATDTLKLVRWDHPGDQENEAVDVFGLTAGGWEFLSTEGDLPNGDTMVASFAGYEAYLVRHVGGPGPGSQWVEVSRVQPAAAFPVEFLDFYAELNEKEIRLTAVTGSELNNDFFSLERRVADQNWEIIDRQDGAGSSNEINIYEFTDTDAPTGVTLNYRIKQVDFDGTVSYTDVVEIVIPSPENDLRVSSLTDGTGSWISGLDERATMRVSTLNGVLVSKSTVTGAGAIQLDLPAGTYVVTLTTGSGGQAAGKVIIGR